MLMKLARGRGDAGTRGRGDTETMVLLSDRAFILTTPVGLSPIHQLS